MDRATLSTILNNFNDSDTIIFATKAMTGNASQLIAALIPQVDYSNDHYLIINKSDTENNVIYYIPYKNILMAMKG